VVLVGRPALIGTAKHGNIKRDLFGWPQELPTEEINLCLETWEPIFGRTSQGRSVLTYRQREDEKV
jgi:hypothetical protein